MKKQKKPRKGGALVGFASHGMPRNIEDARKVDRTTRAEAVALVDKMQATHDAPGARIYKPIKPPPRDFGPVRSRAAEREAGRLNGKLLDPDISGAMPAEVATDYVVAPRVGRRL